MYLLMSIIVTEWGCGIIIVHRKNLEKGLNIVFLKNFDRMFYHYVLHFSLPN